MGDARYFYKNYFFRYIYEQQPKKLVFYWSNCRVNRYYKKNYIELRNKRTDSAGYNNANKIPQESLPGG